jgi:hypothetical protein
VHEIDVAVPVDLATEERQFQELPRSVLVSWGVLLGCVVMGEAMGRGRPRASSLRLSGQQFSRERCPGKHRDRISAWSPYDRLAEVVEAPRSAEKAAPGRAPGPGERLEATRRAQPSLEVLVVALGALLDPFRLVQDARQGRG